MSLASRAGICQWALSLQAPFRWLAHIHLLSFLLPFVGPLRAGKSVMLVPGGQSEALESKSWTNEVRALAFQNAQS